jgi:hypothetical protein
MSEGFGVEDYVINEQKGKHMETIDGETIDGGAPYEFDPIKDYGRVPPEEGDVNYRSAETGQFVSEEEAEAHPDTTVAEKKPAVLAKTRKVMDIHIEASDIFIGFVAKDDDGIIRSSYLMPRDEWDDFGQPDVITVAVVPRDLLNG